MIKRALRSKTIQLAVVQAVVGVLVAVFTELDMVGYIAIIKSVGDVYLRSVTNTPLSEK
jgi:ABC-type amino acid transport system permease subunit|tara:strand:+ start:2344 stop:2520 length:177 start_codon:yes stop_codon:yes gene_type:complete